jgi:hypothetical protein
MKVPIVSNIVWLGHYNGTHVEPVAAVVTAVNDTNNPQSDLVLIAFRNGGVDPVPSAAYSDELADRAWCWPSRP